MQGIESISIKGFKSIREMNLDLRQLNVLIGANGSGKSNFISAFRFLNQIAEKNLQNHVRASAVGAEQLLYFGRKVTSEISLGVRLHIPPKLPAGTNAELTDEIGDEVVHYRVRLAPTPDDNLFFSHEGYSYQYGPKYMRENVGTPLGQGHKESLLGGKLWPEFQTLHRLIHCRAYHFHDTSENSPVKQNGDIHDNRQLRSDGKNLAAMLYLLQDHQPSYYDRIVSTVRLVAPFFDNFVLHPMAKDPNLIRLRWRHRDHADDFDIFQLSDGTLRFICLATLLLQPVPPLLIIIDEPELGLHPSAIALLAEMLQSAATRSQVIISTQSVSLINHFQPDDIVVVDREEDQSVFRRHSADELAGWLEDYSLGEIWEKNLIGGRP
jgi:predicted ATPase